MLHPARGHAEQHEHTVQFYDGEEFLLDTVAGYLVHGLRAGEAVIVVATMDHLKSLEILLSDAGVNLLAARQEARYIALDAQQTLADLLVDGAPDRQRFRQLQEVVIRRARADDREIRIFGEMVAVLWAEGNVTGALQLEELWNELAATENFDLFCAYPMRGFMRPEDVVRFEEVCNAHSRVIPTESHSALPDPDERLREVARLQQRAQVREYEHETLSLRQVQLEDALQRLEDLDKLRNEFVAMVVHDLRAPIAVISGFLELLRDNLTSLSEEQIQDLLGRGMTNALAVSKLVEDILTVSLLESGQFNYESEPFDIAEVVYRAVADRRDAAPKARIEVSVEQDLPLAFADEARQLQVLSNLLTNAIKFSPEGSPVTVTVRLRDGHLQIDVTDEGIGIPAADLPRLFARFTRMHGRILKNVGGSGLGLFICKALVEDQGGSIWVESEDGVGSTFSYTVPVHRDPAG
jgi:signal transduction histidine kinase